MKLTGIKYCGGCNPHIDRTRLAQEIKKLLPPEFILTEDQNKAQWDTGILVCGCLTACADKSDFENLARQWIIVAGNSVDHSTAPEKELAEIVLSKIIS
mgnify:CR=1 FL=1